MPSLTPILTPKIPKRYNSIMKKLTRFIDNHANVFKILVPTFLIVLYVGLCALNINSSTWFDESYSAYLIRGNLADIWSMTAIDVHPPLFYFLLKLWSLIAGTSLVALRSMSVFFGVVSIVLLFQLLRRHFNLTTAIIGSFFFTLSPMLIRYGQEMRMYTIVITFVIAATDVMLRALDANDPKESRRLWFLYAILIALGMWTHYFTALAWIAQLIYILYRQGIFKKNGLKEFWQDKARRNTMLQTYGLAVICYIPWIPFFLKQSASVQGGFWIGPVNLEAVANFFSESLLYIAPRDLKDWLLPLTIALLVLIIVLSLRIFRRANKEYREKLWGLLALIFIPPIVLIILSLPPLSPVYMTRYMIFSLALVWAFCGVIISLALPQPQDRKLSFIATALLVICAVLGVVNVTNREPSGYVGYAVQDVISIAQSGEPLLMNSDWNYYDGVVYDSAEHPVVFYSDWSTYPYSSLEPIRAYHYNVFDDLDVWLSNQDSFWVFYNVEQPLHEELLETHKIDQTISNDRYNVYHLVKK